MFKHFVGHIYLFDKPPAEEDTQLEFSLPDEILGSLDENQIRSSLTDKQVERILDYKRKMSNIVGPANFSRIIDDNILQDSDSNFLLNLATDMKSNPNDWRGFGYLNSSNPNDWDNILYKVVKLKPGYWDASWSKIIIITKALSKNWSSEIPEILSKLSSEKIYIEEFFQLERTVTFKLAALLNDVNELHKILVNSSVDIGGFIGKVSHAFLPSAVYHLEEYGLPRMVSRKIQQSGLINFTDDDLSFRDALDIIQETGVDKILNIRTLTAFDRYVVRFFFDGISSDSAEGSSEQG